jgi:hypothetical protein
MPFHLTNVTVVTNSLSNGAVTSDLSAVESKNTWRLIGRHVAAQPERGVADSVG